MVYPIAYNVNISLFDLNASNFYRGGADFVGLRNYRSYITSPEFLSSLRITLVFTVGSLFFQHAIGWAFALFFNKGFPLSGLLRSLMMVVWVLPAVVAGSLWRWIYAGSYGLLNAFFDIVGVHSSTNWLTDPSLALLGVIIANIWLGIPFHMMLIFAGLQTLPTSIYGSAQIDGAGVYQRFRSLTLPLMRPVMMTTLLLGFVHTFKVFDIIYIMTSGGPANATNVLSIDVYKLSFEYFRLGTGAAAATVLLIIPLALSVVYLILRRNEGESL